LRPVGADQSIKLFYSIPFSYEAAEDVRTMENTVKKFQKVFTLCEILIIIYLKPKKMKPDEQAYIKEKGGNKYV